jgi:hypothetical protein
MNTIGRCALIFMPGVLGGAVERKVLQFGAMATDTCIP